MVTAIRGILGTVRELLQFLRARRAWWMIPMILLLLLFALVIILGTTAGLEPNGLLRVERDDGRTQVVISGDVAEAP